MLHRQKLTSLEICAGAGGQAIGLEQAGFEHTALVEHNSDACDTLALNRRQWEIFRQDVRDFDPLRDAGIDHVDLLAGGVPCTPYSEAGRQLGNADERDLLPEALRLTEILRPKALMIENVETLAVQKKFAGTRKALSERLTDLGYKFHISVLDAQDFGVAQRRRRTVVVALRNDIPAKFQWPSQKWELAPTVGHVLEESMASNGWPGAAEWARGASRVAPTLVGGSMKHGGGDLGPRRSKLEWARMHVNGNSTAEAPPGPDFVLKHAYGKNGWEGYPKLTYSQAALLQGFPPDWKFSGSRTAAYKQVGNAFPPPVAQAVASSIAEALTSAAGERAA
ncbi:DNA cytosine methyltransferase [Streptomyces nojiriensis]|uniref:DNA cytosine methyltransferase n=1 Tax=Streptomyces nojiriensis TaxID=66374 RepID=UPI0036BF5A01